MGLRVAITGQDHSNVLAIVTEATEAQSREALSHHEDATVFTVVIGDVCPQHIDDSVFTTEALLSSQTGE